jgi:hypothetical protein
VLTGVAFSTTPAQLTTLGPTEKEGGLHRDDAGGDVELVPPEKDGATATTRKASTMMAAAIPTTRRRVLAFGLFLGGSDDIALPSAPRQAPRTDKPIP